MQDKLASYSFPKSARLLSRSDFQRVQRKRQRASGIYMTVDFLENSHTSSSRLGISVSRKFGKSNLRNRFKRCLREAFRLSRHQLTGNLDMSVTPLPKALEADTQAIQAELLSLYKAFKSR